MTTARSSTRKSALAALGLLLTLIALAGCNKAAPAASGAKAGAAIAAGKTNAPGTVATNVSLEFVSVFDDTLPRVKTKDPFYPDSTRERVIAETHGPAAQTPLTAPALKLYSVAGPPNGRLAVINNTILATGERSDIKTASGKVSVKVLEIGADYVRLQVEGEAGEERLTLGKKNQ